MKSGTHASKLTQMKWLVVIFLVFSAAHPAWSIESRKAEKPLKIRKPASSQTKTKKPADKKASLGRQNFLKAAPKKDAEEPVKKIPASPREEMSSKGSPAILTTGDLASYDALPSARKKLIEGALATARQVAGKPYKFGGATPQDGFDCSGAMYYVLGIAGLKPPRTSAEQFMYIRDSGNLHRVADSVQSLEDASMSYLQPGDLLFWSGTYAPSDGRSVDVTHVAMFLGREKNGGKPVMINATDGRTYHGRKANGYGVYDFYLPKPHSKSKLVGYGSPPGL